MSFPRAKIHRFNETLPCTPSPADYNLKIQSNRAASTIGKSNRFAEIRSPSASENGSGKSAHSVPCFRTPTLPKPRKKLFSLSSKNTKSVDMPVENDQALLEKTVECNNKDTYIKELMEQIDELKDRQCCLIALKAEMQRQKLRFEENLDELKEEHRIVLQKIYLEHDNEVVELKDKLNETEVEILQARDEMLTLAHRELGSIQIDYQNIGTRLKSKEDQLNVLEAKVAQLSQQLEELESKHNNTIENLEKKHNEERTDLEDAMLKSVAENQKVLANEKNNCETILKTSIENHLTEITNLKNVHQEEIKNVAEETTAKIKQVEENYVEAKCLLEIQMQEKCKDIEQTYKLALETQEKQSEAILKECQAISENSIIQCELEKKEISIQLANKLKELDNLTRENIDLKVACKDFELKCADLKTEELKRNDEIEKCKQELQDALSQKKLYEISIGKSHETIDTLKNRLLNSDRDVEQLTSELATCELLKLEYEDKCNKLSEELEINTKLEVEFINTLRITEQKLIAVEQKLMEKLETYKATAQIEIDGMSSKLSKKEFDLKTAMEQLHEQTCVNSKANAMISTVQARILELEQVVDLKEDVNCNLQTNIALLEVNKESVINYCDYYKVKCGDYKYEINDLDSINKKYLEQSNKYDAVLQRCEHLEQRNAALEKTIAEQKTLIGPFREQLEAYEFERNLLLQRKNEAELEAKECGLKYAQMLGHQNQKQKIKHLIDLKSKNIALAKDNKEMELKLRAQARLIQKLKTDLAGGANGRSPGKTKIGKENVNSPNKKMNGSRVESPCGPLKELSNF